MKEHTRQARLLAYVTLLFVIAAAVIGLQNLTETNATQESNEMASCRSLFNYQVTDAKARLDSLFALGLTAVVADDDERLARLADQIPGATDELNARLEAQRAAIELSASNPGEFLAQCRADR